LLRYFIAQLFLSHARPLIDTGQPSAMPLNLAAGGGYQSKILTLRTVSSSIIGGGGLLGICAE